MRWPKASFTPSKVELIPSRHYHMLQEARAELFDYIEVFYNRQRCHSTLGYRTLAEFEQIANAAKPSIHKDGEVHHTVASEYCITVGCLKNSENHLPLRCNNIINFPRTPWFSMIFSLPQARGRGFYQGSIKQMLSDICLILKVEYIYISVEADNRLSRHVIEKPGLEWQTSLCLLKFLGFRRKWRNEELGGASKLESKP